MKRRKTKIKSIQPVQSEEFEEDIDDSETYILKAHVSQETKDFLKKYEYITFNDKLSLEARGIMFTILSFPRDTIINASLIKTASLETEDEIQEWLDELADIGYIKQIDSSSEQPEYICNVD